MSEKPDILRELADRFGDAVITPQETRDEIPTAWVPSDRAGDVLRFLKGEVRDPYPMLYDLTAIDERRRAKRDGQPAADFSVVYHLLSFARNADVRIKVALRGDKPSIPTATCIWPSANWYEREVWDMFGIAVDGHPDLRRILMPSWWHGHPLRKEHPARATEIGPSLLPVEKLTELHGSMEFRPQEWGMHPAPGDHDVMFLNIGPQHTGTHGLLRVVAELDGEDVVDAACEIGFHHRGAEKMAERQSWHTYIPYTDRVDYLSGALNNLPYVLAVEKLAGIEVPDRAKVIRILLSELYRVSSHLVFFGTLAQDLGQMSPVFYMFSDRERALDIAESITGARMHPSWFRIGGVAQDLPEGWAELVGDFLRYLPGRLREYESAIVKNRIFKARTKGIGSLSLEEAIEWGATGPFLRACGFEWDLRKRRPYSGYEQFSFEVPVAEGGDCFARCVVHVEEMRQSLRIIEQCMRSMPAGPYKSPHPLATPPRKERMLHDIETLIGHFLGVSWGPVIPAGEASAVVESSKGNTTHYLVSDGGTTSYRTRIRTPSFAHLQMVPMMSRGLKLSDLIAILGSTDFVLSDVDR